MLQMFQELVWEAVSLGGCHVNNIKTFFLSQLLGLWRVDKYLQMIKLRKCLLTEFLHRSYNNNACCCTVQQFAIRG